ncbi:MAG: dethiobiotin synthase [Thermoguttaceae bacterium]
MKRVPGLFITGTDTGVGKTHVGALIARRLAAQGHRVGVYKPAASGCARQDGILVSDDAVALWEAAGRPGDLEHVCPQRFVAPLAPHLAALAEGRQLDADLLHDGIDYWRQRSEIILVEGAGGLMSPMGEQAYVADLAAAFGYPMLVVARNVLGCVNHTIQTLMAAATFHGGLPVAGIVLNHPVPPPADDASLPWNSREIVQRCEPPLLAEVRWGDTSVDESVDWFSLAH